MVILTKNKYNATYSFYIMTTIHALCESSAANIAAFSSKNFIDSLLSILRENVMQEVIDDHLTLISLKVLVFVSSVADSRIILGNAGVCSLLNKYLMSSILSVLAQ